MTYSITKNGVELSKDLYTIDEKTKTFSSNEPGLVLDFSDENGWTFNAGFDCTFRTWGGCTFNTEAGCTFNTEAGCSFNTGPGCSFDTGADCTFNTYSLCEFTTKENCVLVRRDIYEIIEIPTDTTIKLHGYRLMGYDIIEKSKCVKLEVEEIKKKIFDLVEKLTRVEE